MGEVAIFPCVCDVNVGMRVCTDWRWWLVVLEGVVVVISECSPHTAASSRKRRCVNVCALTCRCLHHILIAGDVVRAPCGVMHGKTSPVFHINEGLMEGLPK